MTAPLMRAAFRRRFGCCQHNCDAVNKILMLSPHTIGESGAWIGAEGATSRLTRSAGGAVRAGGAGWGRPRRGGAARAGGTVGKSTCDAGAGGPRIRQTAMKHAQTAPLGLARLVPGAGSDYTVSASSKALWLLTGA